ncbi:MAG: glutamate--tRNA ligase family protein, partial [Pseudomonadota bacterium]
DALRSKPEFEEGIKQDLQWLGLNWDEFAKQSERIWRYEEVKNQLIANGRLYPCYETQDELDMKRKLLLSRGLPPIYDRSGLKLTKEQHQEFLNKGIKPHYRFLLEDGDIEWDDLVKGNIHFQAKNIGDPIVIREDGSMTYILCSAIDDVDFGITHVIRGEDHVTNTAIGIQITKAIGGKPPILGHLSLLKSKLEKISKRVGGFDIASIREQFIEPLAIESLLAKMGTSDAIEPILNIQNLIAEFDISKFSSSPVNYDFNELLQLNHKLINQMSYADIKTSLDKLEVEIDEKFWLSTRGNLNSINEIIDWWTVCNSEITPNILEEDREFIYLAKDQLPQGEWDLSTWDVWINNLKKVTERTGKKLFMPIRLALTGKESGPELKTLLPLIGRGKVFNRLSGKNA